MGLILTPSTAQDFMNALEYYASSKTKKYVTGISDEAQQEYAKRVCDFDHTMKTIAQSRGCFVTLGSEVVDVKSLQVPEGYANIIQITEVFAVAGAEAKGKVPYWTHAKWRSEKYSISGLGDYKPKLMTTDQIRMFIAEYNDSQNDDKIAVTAVGARESKLLSTFGTLAIKGKDELATNNSAVGEDSVLVYYLGVNTPFNDKMVTKLEAPGQEERSSWLMLGRKTN